MSQTPGHYDAIVVGGRVAGALTAAGFAGRGMSVLVLEARTFPSATLSTHFFRGEHLVRVLGGLGVLDGLLTQAPKLANEYFYLGGSDTGSVNPADEGGDAGFNLSIRRETLDHLVAQHVAGLTGVDFRTGVKVVDLVRDGAAVLGVADDSGQQHRAPITVGADGRRSGVARRVDAGFQEQHAAARGIYYVYVNGWTSPEGGVPDGAEFSLSGNEMAYVFPSDAGTTCIALTVPLQDFEDAGADGPAFFRRRLEEHQGIWPRFEAATPNGKLFVGTPEESWVRTACGPGWALVGDAGTHQDPWSGRGMDTAARQAEALASVVTSDASTWNAAYAAARDEVTLEHFHATVSAARDLQSLLA
jgi:flavin-dependent dehydrogenase